MFQARLKELLLHEGNLWMDGIHVFKYSLAFILEIAVYNGTEIQKDVKSLDPLK